MQINIHTYIVYQMLASVYRLSALRVVSAYRTVSDEAACVIAGMIQIDILARERQKLYCCDREQATNAKVDSMLEWQLRWDHSEKGRWTYRVIRNIEKWVGRSYGETDSFITQFLSGHGCFRSYLHRFKLLDSPVCPTCDLEEEDVEHVFFQCPRFLGEREELRQQFGEVPTPETIVGLMLKSQDNWELVGNVIAKVMKELRWIEIQTRTLEEEL